MRSRLFLLSIILLIGVSCQHKKATTEKETVAAGNTYTNPLLERGAEPWAIFMKANIIIHRAQKTESYFGKPMI